MDGESCIAPLPERDDWAEALALAAEWDAAAKSATDEAGDTLAFDRRCGSLRC